MAQGPISVALQKSLFAHFSTAQAGVQIKTGAGTLKGVLVGIAGASSSLTLYDGTSTAGALITTISTNGQANLSDLNIQFSTGLFAVLAGSTIPDVTIAYN